MHIKFVTAYLQVREMYKPFLIEYFHHGEDFPMVSEAAQYYEDINKANFKNYKMNGRDLLQKFGIEH